jgi:hypothetical protein
LSYSANILKDVPTNVYPLDETSGTVAYSITNWTPSNGSYVSGKFENRGLPLVYGGKYSTYLTGNNSIGLSLPALGFFTASKQDNDHSLEFWLSIEKSKDTAVKIVGKNSSEHTGIYVKQNQVIFRLQEAMWYKEVSCYVESWEKPVHVVARYQDGSISLVVNGVESKVRNLDKTKLSYYLGVADTLDFYGQTTNLGKVAIDSVALYDHVLSSITCKRHMFYAQGFDSPVSFFTSNSASFEEYSLDFYKPSKTLGAPLHGNWLEGVTDNLVVHDNKLVFALKPEVEFININKVSMMYDPTGFTFSDGCFLRSKEIGSFLKLGNGGLSATVKITSIPTSEEVIASISDDDTKSSMSIKLIPSGGSAKFAVTYNDLINAKSYSEELGSVAVDGNYAVYFSYDPERLIAKSISSTGTVVEATSTSISRYIRFGRNAELRIGASPYFNELSKNIESYKTFKSGSVNNVSVLDTWTNLTTFNAIDTYYKLYTVHAEYGNTKVKQKGSWTKTYPLSSIANTTITNNTATTRTGMIQAFLSFPEVNSSSKYVTAKYKLGSNIETEFFDNSFLDGLSEIVVTNQGLKITFDLASEDYENQLVFLKEFYLVSTIKPNIGVFVPSRGIGSFTKSNTGKFVVEKRNVGALSLGKNSGIRMSGGPIIVQSTYDPLAFESTESIKVHGINMFVYLDSVTSPTVLTWGSKILTLSSGAVSPVSGATVYVDGVLNGTVKAKTWTMISVALSTSITKDTEFIIGSANESAMAVNYVSLIHKPFTQSLINQFRSVFSGILSITGTETGIRITEPANSAIAYPLTWQTVAQI